MNQTNLEQIELKTRDLLEAVVGNIEEIDPPVNLAKILEFYGISLSLAGFKLPEVAGAYDDKEKMIYLLKTDSKKRQAFTIAHEIGHIALGHKRNFDVFYRAQATEFNGAQTKEEKEANYFAASLLMPRELAIKTWEKYHDIELFAAYFGVSRTAAYWRLKDLKLI
jgi:predicted transcriptional regulator